MNRFLTIAALCGISSAFAAHPTARDNDNDGHRVPTVDVNGDGALTAADIGELVIDCDDFVATTNSKASERPYDNVDNDCNSATTDAVTGLTETQFNLFLSGEYGGVRPTTALVEHEVAQCASDATACTVNMHSGRFEVLTPKVKVFEDIFVNGSVVLRNSGQRPDGRELVTVEQYEHFRGGSAFGSASGGSYSGPSKATRTAEALAIATPLVTAEAEARLAADSELERRLGTIEMGNTGRDEELNRQADVDDVLEQRIASSWDAIDDLTEANIVLNGRVEKAGTLAVGATHVANAAASHGPLLEAGVVGGALLHRPLNENGDGESVRNIAIGGGGFELRAGVDASGWQVAGFGQMSFGSDGQGTGPDTSLLIGADVLFDAGPVEVGPFVAYLRTEDHANLLDVTVIENGGLIGVELQGDLAADSAFRAVPFLRLGAGVGYYGTKGLTESGPVVTSDYGGLGLIQGGIRFGAGALKD